MPTATRSHRRIWTVEEWKDFTARCRAVRADLRVLALEFPRTPGISAKHLGLLIKAHREFQDAMARLEPLIQRQHPQLDDVWRFIMGPETQAIGLPDDPDQVTAPKLTCEQWQALGERVMAARESIINLGLELRTAEGKSIALQDRFIRVGQLSSLRCKLDDLVCAQHPDWKEATHVFYGAKLPREAL